MIERSLSGFFFHVARGDVLLLEAQHDLGREPFCIRHCYLLAILPGGHIPL